MAGRPKEEYLNRGAKEQALRKKTHTEGGKKGGRGRERKRLKSCIKDITTLFATPSINYDPSSAPLAIIYILDIA